MQFSTFAHYLQEIENTPSRLAMTEILARLFKEATAEEAEPLCYLCLGRLGPKYSALDLQLAEKMMVRVMAQVTNQSVETITGQYREVGDLGETYTRMKNEELGIRNGGKDSSSRTWPSAKMREPLQVAGEKGIPDLATARRSGMTTVYQVYDQLMQIAKQTGAGSQERKLNLMAQVLTSLDPLSGKYLVRFPLKKLRLGFSELTILDALSWSSTGDKSLRPPLEAAFNVRVDIGAIARIFLSDGLKGLEAIKPKPGTPILPARATPLLDPEEILEKMNGQTLIEPKFDGFRVQIHVDHNQNFAIVPEVEERSLFEEPKVLPVQIFSRNLENITDMFPELVEAASALPLESAILDGEAIAVDPKTGKLLDFQETIKRKRKYGIEAMSQSVPLKAFLFDILYLNGESYLSKALTERSAQLKEIIPASNPTLTLADQRLVTTPAELIQYFKAQATAGLEGIMAKKVDAVYKAGARDFTWVKYKVGMQQGLADTIDAVVMGYFKGKGKWAAFGMGKVLVGIPVDGQIISLSKVGSGFSEESIKEMVERAKSHVVKTQPENYVVDKNLIPDVWLEPQLVIEIRADSVSKSQLYQTGLSLRFPRFMKFRDDKGLEEATTLKELKIMTS